MRHLLPLLVLVGACAGPPETSEPQPGPPAVPEGAPEPEPISEPTFNTAAWVAAVAAAEAEAELVELSAALLDAVDWRTACGEDDPTPEGRGVVRLVPVAGERVLADVTCQRLPPGRVFGLVDLEPGRMPRLVRAFGIGDDGLPTDEPVAGFYGVPTYAPDGGTRFELLTPAASGSGCGLFVRYRLRDDGGAAIELVRTYEDCAAPRPVEDWPVTYAPDRP